MEQENAAARNELKEFDKQHSLRVAVLMGLGFGILPELMSINHPEFFWGLCGMEAVVAGIHLRESFVKRRELVNKVNNS